MEKNTIFILMLLLFIMGMGILSSMVPKPITAQVSPPNIIDTPGQILKLTNWKLTLPTGPAEGPTEIKQPVLKNYKDNPWFVVTTDKTGVRFRAPVNGVTTKNSSYPRSELREMTKNGTQNASWSSTSGTHTLFVDQAVTAVPKKKPHVVLAQIHDASDDVIVIRLEYPNLYINVNGKNKQLLDNTYTLGKRFTAKFVVNNGQTNVYYNNSTDPVYTLAKKYSKAYFKAGVYTQSNCSREAEGTCNNDNFGEAIIYDVQVSHK